MQLVATLLHDEQRSIDRADESPDAVEILGGQRQTRGRITGGRVDAERHDDVIGVESVE